ncbi:BatA domain-containing protein [bacterium]|nr:BatA domain-containing protein [bacterium]
MFSLSFLNSGLLIASLSAIIPILIYFFAKKRPDRVIFSSLKFIISSKEERNSKINLKNILLLIIRTLIILLLTLIFARPIFKTFIGIESNYHAPTTISIIADNSLSMDYYSDDTQRLELLKEKLKIINSKLTNEDYIRIYTKDNYVTGQKFMQGTIADTLIQNISLSYNNISLDSLVVKALRNSKNIETANHEIYLLTDGNEALTYHDSLNSIKYLLVDDNLEWNNFSAQINSAQIVSNNNIKQISIDFVVANYGENDVKDRLIRLNYNDRSYDRFISIEASKSWQGNFTIPIEKSGWQKGFIEVQDEYYSMDNRAYFSFFFNLYPNITFITENNKVSLPLRTMANIFAVNQDNVKFLAQNYVNNQLISDTDIFIFYKLTSIDSNIESLLKQLSSEEKGSLIVLSDNYDDSVTNYIENTFAIRLSSGVVKNIYPDWHNQYHKLISSIATNQLKELRFNDLVKAEASDKTALLLSSNNQPIIANNLDNYLFFFDDNNDFVTNTAYPVLMNKIFENISNSNLEISSSYLGNTIELTKQAEVNDNKMTSNNYTFTDLGIVKIRNRGDNILYTAVNLDENQRSESIIDKEESKGSYQNITENWESHLFSESGKFELLKYLLIAVLVLFVAELLIIKLSKS